MSKKSTTADLVGVDYEKTKKQVVCNGPGCFKTFTYRPKKKYCSPRCRARAGDIRRLDRIKQALRDGTLSDTEIRTLSRLVGKQGATLKDPTPLRINQSHRRVLTRLQNNPRLVFVPSLENLFPSAGRRCRELAAVGLLEKKKPGRYVGYVLKTCSTCGAFLEYQENLDPSFPGRVICPNDHPQGAG